MKICYPILVLLLVGHVSPGTATEDQPETVVQKLYHEVVTRQPLGIPHGADKAAIWPFLSKGLIRKLEVAQACRDDYFRHHFRQHRHEILKPAIGWLEGGLFSGGNEEATPSEAVVERAEPQKDGSFYVHVQLTYKDTFETYERPPDPANTFHWDVAAVVISEGGRFVVDDILFFKEGSTEVESHLSDWFTQCNGPRWIGDNAGGS